MVHNISVVHDEPELDEDDQNHEFEEVVDAIIDHGLFNDEISLLRVTEKDCLLAVPSNIRRHWTINPFTRWCDRQNEKPIAYRVDGFHIWPSDSLSQPFFAAYSEWCVESCGEILHFKTLERAMMLIDDWFPSGRRVKNPEWIGPQRSNGRVIHFGR